MKMLATPVERFWKNVDKNGLIPSHCPELGPCWKWKGYKSVGYGQFGVDKKVVSAHRFSWALVNGKIPKGVEILHKCDNRECPNPEHLFAGTQADNMTDMANKGRSLRGVKHPLAKVDEEMVLQIRAAYIRGVVKQQEVAERFGIDQTQVSNIILRKSWAHV